MVIVAEWTRRFRPTRNEISTLRLPAAGAVPAWLPGEARIAVDVPAEHVAVAAASEQAARGTPLAAVLVPRPLGQDDGGVEIYLQGALVGMAPPPAAGALRLALLSHADSHDGQLVACPATLDASRPGVVTLWLDPAPLGLAAQGDALAPRVTAAS